MSITFNPDTQPQELYDQAIAEIEVIAQKIGGAGFQKLGDDEMNMGHAIAFELEQLIKRISDSEPGTNFREQLKDLIDGFKIPDGNQAQAIQIGNDLNALINKLGLNKRVGFAQVEEGVDSLVLNVSERVAAVGSYVYPAPSAPDSSEMRDDDPMAELDQFLDSDTFDLDEDMSRRADSAREEGEEEREEAILESDEDPEITILQSNPRIYAPGLNRVDNPEKPARDFGQHERMSVFAREVYDETFREVPFNALAELIEQADIELKEKSGSKNMRFRQHLQNIFPIVMLAMAGAREEWREANELNSPVKEDLFKKMQAMEAVFKMLQTMEIMTTNRGQYSQEYYDKKMQDIHHLVEAAGGDSSDLLSALDRIAGRNVIAEENVGYNQRQHRISAFDPDKPSQAMQGAARGLKIEHKRSAEEGSTSVVLTGKFDYNRKDVIGVQTGRFTGVKKIFAQRQDNLHEMKSQVAQFVNYALNDYGKGTAANPIFLQPANSNQSELQLAILMEFKKRAVLEGRELVASDDNGKRIVITPSLDFSNDEKQYFAHYAMQVPKVRAGAVQEKQSDHPAAYHLFKDVKVDGKPLKDNKDFKDSNPEMMMKGMKAALKETVNFSIEKQKGYIDSAANALDKRNLGHTMKV